MTTKALSEMTMTQLIEADRANSRKLEMAEPSEPGAADESLSYRHFLRNRREIRAEIDRRRKADEAYVDAHEAAEFQRCGIA